MGIEANFLVPSIPVGYVPYIDSLLNPSRPLVDDPVTNESFVVLVENVDFNIYARSVTPPQLTQEVVKIREGNSPFPVYIPLKSEWSTFTIERVVLPVGGLADGKNILQRNVFTNWIEDCVAARQSKRTSAYRRSIMIFTMDQAGDTSLFWEAQNCIPVSYQPFSQLSTESGELLSESITLQPTGWICRF